MCLAAILLLLACSLGRERADRTGDCAASPQPTIKHVPAAYTDSFFRQRNVQAYCASCHGVDGKGRRPAAPALKMPTTNLTTLAAKNGGDFSGSARGGGDSGRRHDRGPRQQGHAGVGADLPSIGDIARRRCSSAFAT